MQSAASLATTSNLRSFPDSLPGKLVLAISASVFVALCAHASVPLPFTPVPLTLGNFAVLLVGLLLSPTVAFSALVLYLAEGACGLPVFNPGGTPGLAHLFGPSGGFLFAYPLAAALASSLARRLTLPRYPAAALAGTLSTALILLSGVTWLATLLHLAPGTALKLGILPFLPGEIIKIVAAAGIYASLQRRTA